MNERIKELAEQVGFGPAWFEESQPGYPALPKEGMLKEFAELIVRECVDVVQKEVSLKYKNGGENEEFMNGHYAGSLLARVKIKEHFGVKNEQAS